MTRAHETSLLRIFDPSGAPVGMAFLAGTGLPLQYGLAYNGLGDRLSQTVSGTTTHYTLDLTGGLMQVLSDGESVYLYGRGRVAQEYLSVGEMAAQYFLGDAGCKEPTSGSVRQLTDATEIIMTMRWSIALTQSPQ